jgi:hypothetical protein
MLDNAPPGSRAIITTADNDGVRSIDTKNGVS